MLLTTNTPRARCKRGALWRARSPPRLASRWATSCRLRRELYQLAAQRAKRGARGGRPPHPPPPARHGAPEGARRVYRAKRERDITTGHPVQINHKKKLQPVILCNSNIKMINVLINLCKSTTLNWWASPPKPPSGGLRPPPP